VLTRYSQVDVDADKIYAAKIAAKVGTVDVGIVFEVRYRT
jgi:hypothetical protein